MTARKPKKPVPHINELPPMGADFYYDLLPKLGKQDEQMREAMEILRHPWAKLVLDPEVDRHQAQIALANLIKKAYHLGYEAAQQLAKQRTNAAKAGAAGAQATPEERENCRRKAQEYRSKGERYLAIADSGSIEDVQRAYNEVLQSETIGGHFQHAQFADGDDMRAKLRAKVKERFLNDSWIARALLPTIKDKGKDKGKIALRTMRNIVAGK